MARVSWTDGRVIAVLVVAMTAVVVALPRTATSDVETGSAPWAIALLDELTTGTGDARVPYDRAAYDDGWADDDGDCRNTRHEVLVAESHDDVTFIDGDGCRVATGRWIDPYTGVEMTAAADASIDHVVSLADAHRSGAWRWNGVTKRAFANDLQDPAPLAVADPGVNSRKGSGAPDTWLPEGDESRCAYVVAWVRIKARWQLEVTTEERRALADELDRCDHAGLPETREAAPLQPATIALASKGSLHLSSTDGDCDDRYETVCIPEAFADLDCADVEPRSFAVTSDPHRFDGDGNGIACE